MMVVFFFNLARLHVTQLRRLPRYLKILASVMDCSEAVADLHILCLVQYESSPSVT
ncbi:hypothetical protein BVRB_6g149490 [Beta vulgaris subsp. vulgaris]|nr:hypothetical protein BVRB_6g149490 [Beta vulgaris subsp. vulgaris]